jgi:DUF2075 family protein
LKREYYKDTISNFLKKSKEEIVGEISLNCEFNIDNEQLRAWIGEIDILKNVLIPFQGYIYFEYSIPRMGQRIDVLLIIQTVIFVLEFKIGEKEFQSYAIDQVWDYALDLKNFHTTSHEQYIAPILIASKAIVTETFLIETPHNDKLLLPVKSNEKILSEVIDKVLHFSEGDKINVINWESGRYCPTPTIIEAAKALYNGHSVSEISRSDSTAKNLTITSDKISEIIKISKENSIKSICFVTGVPGAGKTLVGLNIATKHIDKNKELYSVYLSGNGPLVKILREALIRDSVERAKINGRKIRKWEAKSAVKSFIQNVHNFRDECLVDLEKPPNEHVALFDEAQRAWNIEQTRKFMRTKKKVQNFDESEPSFLISCLNRHSDWAVIVCLVGGGQEINTGEAGISEWIVSLNRSYPNWQIFISPCLQDSEYGAGKILEQIKDRPNVNYDDDLHLAVSLRSFRSEYVSLLVKQILDLDINVAKITLNNIRSKYPIVLTRDLIKAKNWLKTQARGSERYGIIVSSQAERLKPYAIDVKSPMDPINWFLNDKDDVRSSYYLEDVATEFDIQGLELDWVCVTWDADFRYNRDEWQYKSFSGKKWKNINKEERKTYLKNAYRVLLTRARQGMVIVVPTGDMEDLTRLPSFYDPIFEYLRNIGFPIL